MFLFGSLVALIMFYVSVIFLHFANSITYMYRKIIHSTVQVAGTLIVYITSLPVVFSSEEDLIRYSAMTVAFVIMPLVLLSRGPLKRHHVIIGKTGLLLYSIIIFIVATYNGDLYVYPSLVVMCLYILYIIVSWFRSLPSIESIIVKNPVGTYSICGDCRLHIAGNGWSYYLNRNVFATEVSSRAISGEYSNNVWGAGTSIGTVQRTLQKRNQTLSSHPCIMGATLGGWVFTSAHGSGGALTGRSITAVKLYDCVSKTITKYSYPCSMLRVGESLSAQRRYIVLEVEIAPVDDIICHLKVSDIQNKEDLHNFMYDAFSINRMIFVDRASAVSLIWSTKDKSNQTFGIGRFIPVWLISIGPRYFTWVRKSDWSRTARLSDANHFAPDPPYFSGLVARFFTNIELYIRPVPPKIFLWTFIEKLQQLFKDEYRSARCEIRIERNTLFLDFSFVGAHDFKPIYRLVRYILQPTSMYFHKGKFIPQL